MSYSKFGSRIAHRTSSIALLVMVLGGVWGCGLGAGPGAPQSEANRPATAEQALTCLVEGNHRFASGHVRHPDAAIDWRRKLVHEQHPFATILGCSDSRVPPELLFDQGFGDIFDVRVAGNVVDPAVAGSVEYAVDHLHTPLLVVLGHEDCGAVKAALAPADEQRREPPEIQSLIRLVHPETEAASSIASAAERVHAAVEANVRHAVDELAHLPALHRPIVDGKLTIIGAVYDLETGLIRVIP